MAPVNIEGGHQIDDRAECIHFWSDRVVERSGKAHRMRSDRRSPNLPVQSTPLIGRERDVAIARQLLLREDVRDAGDVDLVDSAPSCLQEKRVLLLLDTFEQVQRSSTGWIR
jgi:hypothetical protein